MLLGACPYKKGHRCPRLRPLTTSSSGRIQRKRTLDHPSQCVRGTRGPQPGDKDRKSTRLNSSHSQISYAVFCLKKKNISCPPRARARDCQYSQSAPLLLSFQLFTVSFRSHIHVRIRTLPNDVLCDSLGYLCLS